MSSKITLSDDLVASRLSIKRREDAPRVGYEERRQTWNQTRATAAQLLMSEPGILNYMKARHRGTVLQEMSNIHGLLCKLVSLISDFIEGPETELEDSAEGLRTLVQKRIDGTQVPLSALKSEAASALRGITKQSVRRRRSTESVTLDRLSAIQREVELRLSDVRSILSVAAFEGQSLSLLESVATGPVYEKLFQAAQQTPSMDQAVEIALSIGSLESMSRAPSIRYQLHKDRSIPFPFDVEASGATLTFSTSPALLGIQVGDVINAGGVQTTVSAVAERSVTVADEVASVESVFITDPGYTTFKAFSDAVRFVFDITAQQVTKSLSLHNRPDASKAAARIAGQAALIAPLTVDAQHALSVLGTDVDDSRDALSALRALNVEEPAATTAVIDRLRDLFRDEGFFVADEKILRGDITVLFEEDPRAASSSIADIDAALGLFATNLRSAL
jgi:hypothetical protein